MYIYNYVCIVRVWRVSVCAYKKIEREGGLNYLPFAHTHTERDRETHTHTHILFGPIFLFFIYLLLSCCLFLFFNFLYIDPYL
jgi:hypothetical protein